MRDLSTLKVGDRIKLKPVDDMMFNINEDVTLGEAYADGAIDDDSYDAYAQFSNMYVTVHKIFLDSGIFRIRECKDGGIIFYAGDIEIWPNEPNINTTDILEFIGV